LRLGLLSKHRKALSVIACSSSHARGMSALVCIMSTTFDGRSSVNRFTESFRRIGEPKLVGPGTSLETNGCYARRRIHGDESTAGLQQGSV